MTLNNMKRKRKKLAIIGASGHGREVADIAIASGYDDIVFLASEITGCDVMGFPLRKEEEHTVRSLHVSNYQFTVGIGDPQIKKKVTGKYPYLNFPNLIHPASTFGYLQDRALEGTKGNVITAGCRFTNNISFGNFGFFGLNTAVGHDCEIKDYVSIMPGVIISGNVIVETGVFIGAGATIVQGRNDKKNVIGADSFICIGSVVIGSVSNDTKVFGNPAVLK